MKKISSKMFFNTNEIISSSKMRLNFNQASLGILALGASGNE